MSQSNAPAHCAICGADIPPLARACPECGADERTGWREQSIYDGLNLPDEESNPTPPSTERGLFWKISCLVLVVVAVLHLLFNRLFFAL